MIGNESVAGFRLPENNADWSDAYWRNFDRISDIEAGFLAPMPRDESVMYHQQLYQTLLEPSSTSDQPMFEHWRSSLARTLVFPERLFPEHIQIRKDIDLRHDLELGLFSTVALQAHQNHLELVGTAKSLHDFLSARALALENTDGSLHSKLHEIAGRSKNWHNENRQQHGTVTDDHDDSDDIYVLNCRRLHLISKQKLARYLGNIDARSQQVS